MSTEGIRRALMVGAGTMGRHIELQRAMRGHAVTVHHVAARCPQAARARTRIVAERLVSGKRLAHGETDAAQSRIAFTTDPGEAAMADLLSESVPEDLDLNSRVFAQFHKLFPPYTIFTTDTPTLVPSPWVEANGRSAQFAAFHFHTYVRDSRKVLRAKLPSEPGMRTRVCGSIFARKRISNAI